MITDLCVVIIQLNNYMTGPRLSSKNNLIKLQHKTDIATYTASVGLHEK
jgi:hypothetical protein